MSPLTFCGVKTWSYFDQILITRLWTWRFEGLTACRRVKYLLHALDCTSLTFALILPTGETPCSEAAIFTSVFLLLPGPNHSEKWAQKNLLWSKINVQWTRAQRKLSNQQPHAAQHRSVFALLKQMDFVECSCMSHWEFTPFLLPLKYYRVQYLFFSIAEWHSWSDWCISFIRFCFICFASFFSDIVQVKPSKKS